MLKDILRLSFLGVLLIAIAGCEVSNPGSALTEQPPKTYLVLAPADSTEFNHFAHLKWFGTDPDGEIAGFWILIDGDTFMFTEAYEDTIPFYAPGDTTVPHQIQITAVDNVGLVDPSPPSRFFYASNTRPSLAFAAGMVSTGDTVGKGFAVRLEGYDLNPSSLFYSIAIDDTLSGWTPWAPYPTFLFCDKRLEFLPCTTATWLDVPCSATLIDNEILTLGAHTIYARVKDAGEAMGLEVLSVDLFITEGSRPTMDTLITASYGADDFYLDGSTFYERNRETVLSFRASADDYHGQINAYKYRLGDNGFGPWQETSEIVILNLPSGEHRFNIMARDVAGEFSDTISYSLFILEPEFSDSILIVDETRDGNGNLGSPEDGPVDDFYEMLVGNRPHRQIDYATHQIPAVTGVSYLSPLDLYRFSLVIYHTDDYSTQNLADNRVVLADYMDRGGNVILSGWDLLYDLNTDDSDSVFYSGASIGLAGFVYEYMRLHWAIRARPRECVGLKGVGGYPDVAIDPEKVPGSWNGALKKCWTFVNRGYSLGETITLATFDAASDSSFEGRHAAHVYLSGTYKVAVFGIPLYFCYEDEAKAFFERLLIDMGY